MLRQRLYLPSPLKGRCTGGHNSQSQLQGNQHKNCRLPEPLVEACGALQTDRSPLEAVAPVPDQLHSSDRPATASATSSYNSKPCPRAVHGEGSQADLVLLVGILAMCAC